MVIKGFKWTCSSELFEVIQFSRASTDLLFWDVSVDRWLWVFEPRV